MHRSRRSSAKYASATPAPRTRTQCVSDGKPTSGPSPKKPRTEPPRRTVPATSLAFPRLPPELLQRVVEQAAGRDVTTTSARRTLSHLRLVNRALCLVASRVAHSHIFVTNADSARRVLDAIVLDTKKRPGAGMNSQTSFYAPDVRALTIEHKFSTSGARSPVTSVLMRLPAAIRRLCNLKSFAWRTTERPTFDIVRALGQLPSLTSLEIRDHQTVNAKCQWGLGCERYTRHPLFPPIGQLYELTHLSLKLMIDEDGQFGGSAKWRDFCKHTLSQFQLLQSLVIEIRGTYNAEAAALCQLTFPHLRRLALNGIHFFLASVDAFPVFLSRHPQLEELDVHDRIKDDDICLWGAIGARIEHDTRILPKLQRLSIGAATGAEFVQTLLLIGFRDLRSVALARARLADDHYMALMESDSAHAAVRCEAVEELSIVVTGIFEILDLAEKFPNLRRLDADARIGIVWDEMAEYAAELKFPRLEFLRLKFSDLRWSDGSTQEELRTLLHSRALQLVQAFPNLRGLQIDWTVNGFSNQYRSVILSWDTPRVDGGATVLQDFEVEEIDCTHETGRPVPWPTFPPAP
ncbi:hypothetical protein AURDEDRAFT_188969 [Auricularia subglabra TFB-10046 SS5]|uniref:F-box domain-containing protein n=1 Tax=Auricularia subglabra (strain TFB-10046 / SS5) TaxID=717982 RepID=J0LDF4_AURST|nr:hypothetical protein AURDEDRAFT_188969 [Auricularia subglabra TFB-10046 SS5]